MNNIELITKKVDIRFEEVTDNILIIVSCTLGGLFIVRNIFKLVIG